MKFSCYLNPEGQATVAAAREEQIKRLAELRARRPLQQIERDFRDSRPTPRVPRNLLLELSTQPKDQS